MVFRAVLRRTRRALRGWFRSSSQHFGACTRTHASQRTVAPGASERGASRLWCVEDSRERRRRDQAHVGRSPGTWTWTGAASPGGSGALTQGKRELRFFTWKRTAPSLKLSRCTGTADTRKWKPSTTSRMLTIGSKSAFERVEELCLSKTIATRGTMKGVK